jgi:hypothetical protein
VIEWWDGCCGGSRPGVGQTGRVLRRVVDM